MNKQKSKGSGMKRLALSVTFLTSSLAPLTTWGADGVLRGRVTDKSDGEGVVGAAVSISGTNIATATDIDGNFVLRNVPPKQQKVTVSSIGYAQVTQVVTLSDGQTATLNFSLGQTTIMASEVVVGAALYKQDRLEVPVTTNVVSKEQIQQAPNPTLADAVENVPGVVVSRAGGYGTSTIQIRGSNTFQGGGIGTRIQGLYDGFPINTPTTGEIVWTNVNMNAADRVEVLKGAAATLYGSGAMGGVMNVYGSLPDTFQVKAGGSIGFYDAPPDSDNSVYRDGYTPILWNSYVGFGNSSEKWKYNLLYSHSKDDGFRAATQTNLNDLKFKAKYSINAHQYMQITSFYNETEGGYPTTWPFTSVGTLMYADLDHRYDIAHALKEDDTIKRKNILVGFNYVNLLSDNFNIDTKLYYTRNESRVEYNPTATTQQIVSVPANALFPGSPAVYSYNRQPGEFNEDIADRYGAGTKLDWKLAEKHRILLGIDANVTEVQSTQYTADLPAIHPLTEGDLNKIQEKNIAVFLQEEYKPTNKLTVLASMRYDWSGIDSDTVTYRDYSTAVQTQTTADITNTSVDAVSPRIAANYKLSEDMSCRASWGMSFRAPTLAERFVTDAGLWKGNPNPDLDKETMTAYEIGVFKQFNEKISLDIAGYLNDYKDLIESRFLTGAAGPYFVYGNIDKARIWGIETNLNVKPGNTILVNLGYSYMNAINRSYTPGNTTIDANIDPEWLPSRPEHTFSASTTWEASKKLSFNVNARYMSKVKAVKSYTADHDAYPGDFVVVNLGAKMKINESVSATFTCKNVGNTQYSEAEWFPAPNRTFMAGIDLTY